MVTVVNGSMAAIRLRVVGCGAAGVLQGVPVAQAKHLAPLVLSHNSLSCTLPDDFLHN